MKNVYVKLAVFVFLIVFWAVSFSKAHKDFQSAKTKNLYEIPPDSFDDIVFFLNGKSPLKPQRIKAYLNYARELIRVNPQSADAWGLLGFCLFQRGDFEEALKAYGKSAELVPRFYGFHYNLAYVFLKNGKYPEALAEVQKALLCDPRESLLYIISSSKIYAFMMVARVNHFGIPAEEQLKQGYQKAYQLMAAIEYRQKMGTGLPGEENLTMEGF